MERETLSRPPPSVDTAAIAASERLEIKLAYQAAPVVVALAGRLPSRLDLMRLSIERGPELAAVVFYKAVLASPLHAGFVRAVLRARLGPKMEFKTPLLPNFAGDLDPVKLELVVIPSSTPGVGPRWGSFVAGARDSARRVGFTTDVVETSPFASIAGNARAIADFLASRPSDAKIIFLTFGQGASELRFFLQKRMQSGARGQHELGKVRGWISVAGAFGGAACRDEANAPGLNRLLLRVGDALSGRSFATRIEAASQFPLWRERFVPPRRTLIASLVPVPMPWQLSPRLRSVYKDLTSRGPSDGAVLLADSMVRPGLVFPALGLSHASTYAEWSTIIERTLVVFNEALCAQDQRPHAPVADLSVVYNETDPRERERRRADDLALARREESERAARRLAQRAKDAAERRARVESQIERQPESQPETIRTAEIAPPQVEAAPAKTVDPWSLALASGTGRARFDAIEWELAQFIGAKASVAKPRAGEPAAPLAPVPPIAAAVDADEDEFQFL